MGDADRTPAVASAAVPPPTTGSRLRGLAANLALSLATTFLPARHAERSVPPLRGRAAAAAGGVTLGYGLRPEQAFPRSCRTCSMRAARRSRSSTWPSAAGRRGRSGSPTSASRGSTPDQVVVSVCLNDIPEMHNHLARPPRVLHEIHSRSALVRRLVGTRRREVHDVKELFESPESPSVGRARPGPHPGLGSGGSGAGPRPERSRSHRARGGRTGGQEPAALTARAPIGYSSVFYHPRRSRQGVGL